MRQKDKEWVEHVVNCEGAKFAMDVADVREGVSATRLDTNKRLDGIVSVVERNRQHSDATLIYLKKSMRALLEHFGLTIRHNPSSYTVVKKGKKNEGGNMSYDIDLVDPVTNEVLTLDGVHQMKGGTYRIGGTDEATLNVTYNYGKHYYRVFGDGGIRTIYGMTGAESIPVLEGAIAQLGDEIDPDYWTATEGNAKQALCQLLAFAKMRPDGVWAGD